MNFIFAETLRKLREEKGLSQKQLGKIMFVNHSTIARWENGSRLPDAAMILRIADTLGADVNTLLRLAAQSEESPNVIMVDDSKVILSEGISVLSEVLPNAAAGSDRIRKSQPRCPCRFGYRARKRERA